MARTSKTRASVARLRRQMAPVHSSPARPRAVKAIREEEPLEPFSRSRHLGFLLVASAASVALLIWAYWPTFLWMEQQWRTEPDYSHGYLVVPLAALIAYSRLDLFPGVRPQISWAGISLLLLAIAVRVVGRLGYMDFMDGWSLLPWVAGVTWMLVGPKALRWALPSVAFLLLLVPLPYRAESLLSWKLQGVATEASTALLRIFGQPAVSEGHTIWLGQSQLMVEDACSGLRIFVGIGALAFFWASMVRRAWLDRVVILVAALPLAILANVIRVTAMALFSKHFEGAVLDSIHDWMGFAMIALAAFMLWAVKTYWEYLYRPVEILTAGRMLAARPL
jgi:exosortase